MADTETTAGALTYYPLTKMNFLVTVSEIQEVAAFSEVSGIDSSVDVIEFRQGNSASLAPVKIPGLVKNGNISLKMGYVREQEFKDWIISCLSPQRAGAQRRTVTIEMIDISSASPTSVVDTGDTTAHVVWQLSNAWVCKYTGPDLNASTSEVAIESVELAYEEITIPN